MQLGSYHLNVVSELINGLNHLTGDFGVHLSGAAMFTVYGEDGEPLDVLIEYSPEDAHYLVVEPGSTGKGPDEQLPVPHHR